MEYTHLKLRYASNLTEGIKPCRSYYSIRLASAYRNASYIKNKTIHQYCIFPQTPKLFCEYLSNRASVKKISAWYVGGASKKFLTFKVSSVLFTLFSDLFSTYFAYWTSILLCLCLRAGGLGRYVMVWYDILARNLENWNSSFDFCRNFSLQKYLQK